jgi:hypothetical protein
MHAFAKGVFVGLAAAAGCAHAPAPAGPRVRLTVLPSESDEFPQVAAALNEALGASHVPGVDERYLSKVPLEVAQLSVECVDPTNACYAAVGRAIPADRLLLARVALDREHHRYVQVTVTLFDVGTARPIGVTERTFGDPEEARRGVVKLVADAMAAVPGATAAAPAQGAQP